MARKIIRPENEVTEEIINYTHHSNGCIVAIVARGVEVAEHTVRVNPGRDFEHEYVVAPYFKADPSAEHDEIVIEGDDYDAMMSEDPPWCPGKPANSFAIADLWSAVDAKRNGLKLAHGRKAVAVPAPIVGDTGQPQ